jgi:hypothetical protein
MGVRAGDGEGVASGVGSSRIGERHLLIPLRGISNKMVGGWSRLPLPPTVLWALRASSTGTSIVLLWLWR